MVCGGWWLGDVGRARPRRVGVVGGGGGGGGGVGAPRRRRRRRRRILSASDGRPRRCAADAYEVADAFVDVRARAVGVCVHRNRVGVCVDVGAMSTTRVRARCVEETGE